MKITKSAIRKPLVVLAMATTIMAGVSIASCQRSTAYADDRPIEVSEILTLGLNDMNWVPLDLRNPEGVAMAVLWGNPNKGSFGALLKVPAGFESPMHVHSQGERIVQIKGTSMHWGPDGDRHSAPILEPGDYFQMPGGIPHVSATGALESIEFITMDGAFDFELAE